MGAIHTSWSYNGMISQGNGGVLTVFDNFSMHQRNFAMPRKHCEISQSVLVLPDFTLLPRSIVKLPKVIKIESMIMISEI